MISGGQKLTAGAPRRFSVPVIVFAMAVILLATPDVGSAANCPPIVNPYAGSRYEGIDLRQIQAKNVNCEKARKVVRRAHRKAFRVFTESYEWHAWKVRSDLSGRTDHYRAKRGDARVSWVF